MIKWEDGILVSSAKVNEDGTITPAVYSGNTPLSAFNLNKAQEITEFYKGTNIIAETIEGFGKIKKLYGKAEGVGTTGTIEIISKKGSKKSSKIISISNPLIENEYIDFIEQKVIRNNGTEEYIGCTCGITQYEGETTIYNTEGAELEVELTNNKAMSSANENIVNLQEDINKKVKKTGDTMTGILRFENKKEFSGIEKTRTIDDIDYVAKIGIGAVKSIGLEISANGEIKGRLDIMADGTIKNYKTGNLLVEEGGWITATLNSGVKATDTGLGGFKGIRYRKIGNHVYVIGSISTTWDGTNQRVLTTLPAGYRPKFNNYVFCPLTSSNIARIYIANDGRLVLEWVKNLGNGNNVTTELSWVSVKIDFFVD